MTRNHVPQRNRFETMAVPRDLPAVSLYEMLVACYPVLDPERVVATVPERRRTMVGEVEARRNSGGGP